MSFEMLPGVSLELSPTLAEALMESGDFTPPLRLIERIGNRRSGVNGSEILTLRDGSGRLRKVLRKTRLASPDVADATTTLKYEATVLRDVLERFLGERLDQ